MTVVKIPAWFQRVVLRRMWLSFIVMGLAFFIFGASTLNLFFLLRANTALFYDNGWMALADGGAQQLAELLVTGYLSMAAYVVFKTCEYRLAHWLGDPPEPEPPVSPEPPSDNQDHPS